MLVKAIGSSSKIQVSSYWGAQTLCNKDHQRKKKFDTLKSRINATERRNI